MKIESSRPLRKRTKTNRFKVGPENEKDIQPFTPTLFCLCLCVCVRGITTLETKWPFSVLHKPESTPPNWIVEAFAVNAQELTFGASDRYADILRVQWQACEETAGSRAGGSSRRPEG